jgi:CRISPR-associated protein (TIGR02710 family)
MIMSVGGSPEPLVASLNKYEPQYVCFFASQQSIDMVPRIKDRLTFSPQDYKVIVDNAEDILECYEKALECCRFFEQNGILLKDVVIDYTGGTKAMSAALALLAVSKGCSLSYVGGSQRDKGGLGEVISGYERVFAHDNPWEIMGVEETKRAATLFNKYQFEAAESQLEEAIRKVRKREALRYYLDAVKKLCQGYDLWDRFAHKEALGKLKKGLDGLKSYAAIASDQKALEVTAVVEENVRFLQDLSAESSDFTKPSRKHVLDLLANARRRSEEGKYDDAVARLYRTLELLAQLKLQEYGIKTSSVDVTKVPKDMVGELRQRYTDPSNGRIKLPLKASYDLLLKLNDQLGEEFKNCKGIDRVLDARNNSILAHGFQPVGRDIFDKLWELILQFSQVDESEVPVFPKLSSF